MGTGPNGCAAAVALGRAGREVALYEARETSGAGAADGVPHAHLSNGDAPASWA
ncbi:NAD(P)-binding protein [Streptomyces rishiriensis]|uniref:NAD(P)-binding protein n=1 Tax=Streptomyces rishiriensis TaxID=68264 RepID=UPI0027D88F73|nr:NAD(P)-binding protein [Streptomyces rishiriensis]